MNKKLLLASCALALVLLLMGAALFQPFWRGDPPAQEAGPGAHLPSTDDLGPDHEPDFEAGGEGLDAGNEEGASSSEPAADFEAGTARESDGPRADQSEDGSSGGPPASAPPPAGPGDDAAQGDASGRDARTRATGSAPVLSKQPSRDTAADPALRALKASLQRALAASGSQEASRLGKLLDGADLAGAIPKVRRALTLLDRMDAVGRRLSLLDEEFNLKRIELQADRQARGGREGALRRELSDMERRLRGESLELGGLRKEFESIAGKTPPPDPAQSRMPFNLPVSGAARTAVQTAYAQLGKPYVWGADGTRSYDCSGLVMHAWDKAGVDMVHSSRVQSRTFPTVPRNALAPGDLLYFYNPVHHVAMYVGEGKMIHAPATGDVVRVAPVNWKNFVWANRPQPKAQR